MKGIVFIFLNRLVEEKYGLALWDTILETVQPKSNGIYTSGKTYPDNEIVDLVSKLSELSRHSIHDLLHVFGHYMFAQLSVLYPDFLKTKDLKSLLLSVDSVIHKEVNKLYPDANVPKFTYEEPNSNTLIMVYSSARKLCPLAIGLIEGAADHYCESISHYQESCMLDGASECRIRITFK